MDIASETTTRETTTEGDSSDSASMDLKAKAEVARAVANVSEAYHTNERELREEIDALNR